MGIVELDRRAGRERPHAAFQAEMAVDDVLQGRGDEEVLLAQPQLLAGRRRIARIEEFRDRLGARHFRHRAEMVAAVERLELHRIDRARRPQPQRVDVPAAPADDRGIEGDRLDRFVRNPLDLLRAVRPVDAQDVAAIMNVVDDVRALELPRVAGVQPVFGKLLLPSFRDELLEQAMLVADAVTLRRDGKARHAVHEAGGEPSEAAVAKCCVRLNFGNVAQADAEIAQRGLEPAHQLHVAERIAEQPADQEFEREIVDALLSAPSRLALGFEPALHDPVAQRQRRGNEPVVLGRAVRFLADDQRDL